MSQCLTISTSILFLKIFQVLFSYSKNIYISIYTKNQNILKQHLAPLNTCPQLKSCLSNFTAKYFHVRSFGFCKKELFHFLDWLKEILCPKIITRSFSIIPFSRSSLGITPLIGNFRVKAKLRLRFDP